MTAVAEYIPEEFISVNSDRYRVMVVDDSAVIRGFICRYLQEDPDIEVVTTASNGVNALAQLDKHDVEVVVLDIEMPVMDGMTALPQLIDKKPDLAVVMASTLTLKNATVSLEALQKGARDYVPKPESTRDINASIDFRREIVEKVKAWAGRRRVKRREALPGADTSASQQKLAGSGRVTAISARPRAERPVAAGFVQARRPSVARPGMTAPGNAANDQADSNNQTGYVLRKSTTRFKPSILAVGSSTGGPQALITFFSGFKSRPKVPIVITQHMPAHFTKILGQHLSTATGWAAEEAAEGTVLQPGQIYIAPGDYHLLFKERDGAIVCHIDQGMQENFCRPAVDPMYRSLINIYKDRVLAVILTGMGHDGLKGARELVRLGGDVLAQDEKTSVVWGMPGAVATAGLCTEVLPIDQLGAATERRLQGVL